MSGFGLGNVLYDVTKSSVFGARNMDKTANGDIVRAGVCAGQAKNALASIADDYKEAERVIKAYGDRFKDWEKIRTIKPENLSEIKIPLKNGKGFLKPETIKKYARAMAQAKKCQANPISHAGNDISKVFQSVGQSDSAFKYVVRGANWAAKVINPLICVSGGVKVVMADDKTSEGIKQTAALSSMFAGEALARSILTEKGRRIFEKKALGQNTVAKKLVHWGRVLDNYKMRKCHLKGAKVIVPVAKALAFIGTSIASYSIGSMIGDTINEARKKDVPKLVANVPDKKVDLSA